MDGWVGCPPIGLGLKGLRSNIPRCGEPAYDATAKMSPFWNCPSRWRLVAPMGEDPNTLPSQ